MGALQRIFYIAGSLIYLAIPSPAVARCAAPWIFATQRENPLDIESDAEMHKASETAVRDGIIKVCDRNGTKKTLCVGSRSDLTTDAEFTVIGVSQIYAGPYSSRVDPRLVAVGGWVEVENGSSPDTVFQTNLHAHCEKGECTEICKMDSAEPDLMESEAWIACRFFRGNKRPRIPTDCWQVGYRYNGRLYAYSTVKFIRSFGVVRNSFFDSETSYHIKKIGPTKGKILRGKLVDLISRSSFTPLTVGSFTETGLDFFAESDEVGRKSIILNDGTWEVIRFDARITYSGSSTMDIIIIPYIWLNETATTNNFDWHKPSQAQSYRYRDALNVIVDNAAVAVCGGRFRVYSNSRIIECQ